MDLRKVRRGTTSRLCALALSMMVALTSFGACAENNALAEEFDALMPLMDAVASAADASGVVSVGGEEDALTVAFTRAFLAAAHADAARFGIPEETLLEPASREALLDELFLAAVPRVTGDTREAPKPGAIGVRPLAISTLSGDRFQVVAEMIASAERIDDFSDGLPADAVVLQTVVFTFETAPDSALGVRLAGFAAGGEIDFDGAVAEVWEGLLTAYDSPERGFSLQYPAAFDAPGVVETADGVSGMLADGSASFYARRAENADKRALASFAQAELDAHAGGRLQLHEESGYATLAFEEGGDAVFRVYLVTDAWIYEAELRCREDALATYAPFRIYLENSFNAHEISVG